MINDIELKKEFIQWFGKEKWEEQETLYFLQMIAFDICEEYLAVEPVPLIFDELDGMIAMLDINEGIIRLNTKYLNNKIELVAALVHELEHLYQLDYISDNDNDKANRWNEELSNYLDEKHGYNNETQEIEIDAEAFTQVVLYCEFGIYYKNSDPRIQKIIDEYIEDKRLLED